VVVDGDCRESLFIFSALSDLCGYFLRLLSELLFCYD